MLGGLPYLLSYGVNAPVGYGGPTTYADLLALNQDFYLPPKSNHNQLTGDDSMRWAGTNQVQDLAAPGIRDMVPRPAPFANTAHRGSTWTRQRVENNAPLGNLEKSGADGMWDYFTDPNTQRLQSAWWQLTHQVAVETPGFAERGQFSVPKTGFTALRHLRPASTLKPI